MPSSNNRVFITGKVVVHKPTGGSAIRTVLSFREVHQSMNGSIDSNKSAPERSAKQARRKSMTFSSMPNSL